MKNDQGGHRDLSWVIEATKIKLGLAVVDLIGSATYKALEGFSYLARKNRVFYLETKFASLKKGDIITLIETVKLFKTSRKGQDNTLVEFVEASPPTSLLVLRVAWPEVPYDYELFQESAMIEVLFRNQIWILYLSQSAVFERIPFKKMC